MNDNIRSIFQGGRKSEGPGGEFYSTSSESLSRIDFRWSGGYRASLPYGRSHEIHYLQTDAGSEELLIVYPGLSVIRLIGRQLVPLYESLVRHQVEWIRDRGKSEDVPGAALCVESIDYFQMTDWEMDYATLQELRRDFQKATS